MPLISTLVQLSASSEGTDKLLYLVGNEQYSYQDMLNRVSQIQQCIKTHTKPRDNVVVTGHKEFDMYCSAIACVMSNRRFVPVDNSLDKSRLNTIVDICQPSLTLHCADSSATGTLASTRQSINTRAIAKNVQPICTADLPSAEDIAYIIFTSGTTGTPKGVQVSLEALEDFLLWTESDFFGFSSKEVFVNHALYSFDLSVFELWTALATGNTIVSLTHDNNTNSRMNIRQLAASNASCFVATPSFIELMLLDWKFNSAKIPSISAFVFCGEVLNKTTVEALNERFPNARVFNLYGPTEATCATTGIVVTAKELATDGSLTVGQVKPNTRLLIDEQTQEVIICGNNVAHGYMNVSNAESFFDFDGKRAYRTGDAGYINSQGQLFITGRIDRQIKFKGYRIELDEIEHHLNQSLDGQAAVLAISSGGKVTGICAFVAIQKPLTLENVSDLLLDKLPLYMCPTRLEVIEAMPLNSNGKIDRKALLSRIAN